jgi:hypothetical protein
MTQQHPITPPPELVQQWIEYWKIGKYAEAMESDFFVAARAAQWGADQELEACLNWLTDRERFPVGHEAIEDLKAERRPKPPSLKEQALIALHAVAAGANDMREQRQDFETIRRALEQLDD